MKKKILIILLIVIVILIGVIGYFVFSDLGQEKKLNEELTEISDLTNAENINIDEINNRLNNIVTNGDYAIVEKAFKSYLKDNFDNSTEIANILNDEKLLNILTPENYKKDGKDFKETKEYINTTKEELEKCKENYKEFLTEDKMMSYIEDKGLDSYYIDLYKNDIIGDIEEQSNDKTVENSIDEVIEILNVYEEVINFLSKNSNSWEIQDDNIVFDSESLSNKYDELISKLPQ